MKKFELDQISPAGILTDGENYYAVGYKTENDVVYDVTILLETQQEIINTVKLLLNSDVCRIVFKKSNGDHRDMYGTTYVPIIEEHSPDKVPSGKGKRYDNPQLISVFDVDKQDWRSFFIDKLISIGIV